MSLLVIPLFCKMLFWLLGAGLLGILLGYLWQLAKIDYWKNLFGSKEEEYTKLERDYNKISKKDRSEEKSKKKWEESTAKLKSEISALRMTSSKHENNYNLAIKDTDKYNSQIASWKNRYEDLETSIRLKDGSIDALQEQVEKHEKEIERMRGTVSSIRSEKDDYIKIHGSYKDRFEEANLERNTLKAKYENLINVRKEQEEGAEKHAEANVALQSELDALKAEMTGIKANAESSVNKSSEELANYKAQMETAVKDKDELQIKYESLLRHQEAMENQAKDTSELDALQAKYNDSNAELESLRQQLANAPKSADLDVLKAQLAAAPAAGALDEWRSKWESSNNKNADLQAEIDRLKNAAANTPPPSDEYKAKWETLNTERANWISKNNSLNAENERLKMEWEKLKAEKATPPPAPAVVTPVVSAPVVDDGKEDDLKKVEGIGPKIESLLKADGIKTWHALANADVNRLRTILDNAGSRFRMHDPGTWPKQAGMCHAGDWDALKKWQDELDGGR